MSSRPNAATVASTDSARASADPALPTTASTRSSAPPAGPSTSSFAAAASSSGLRAVIVTEAPRVSSSAAMACPMPRLAPVTSAALPVRSVMTGTLRRKPARADRYSGRRDLDRVDGATPRPGPHPPGESPLITATDLELRAGSRILLSDAMLRVQPGDRIGLVGRNGAGKTTTMRVLAGEGEPYGGAVAASGPVGYLPQDPREGDLTVTA